MEVLVYLIPVALFLGGLGLAAFIWSLKSGQFDDLEGAAMRILNDEDEQQQKPDVNAQLSDKSRGNTKPES
jgi:cbb3-type cytochrome oxidase maturation protein